MRLLDGHVQHFVDVLALVVHLQRFAVVAFALADVARHVDVRQEVHLHFDHAVSLARFAAPALDVEAESPGAVAAGAGFLRLREEVADRGEQPGVGGGVGARRAADGALVDVHHLVQQVEAVDVLVALRRHRGGAVQRPRGDRIQRVVHQGGLAGTGDAGDAGEQTGGNVHGDVAQIVAAGARQPHHARGVVARARAWHGDGLLAGKVLPGHGLFAAHDVGKRAARHDGAAVDAGAGADVHDVIGGANGLLVVFHHQHRVADVAQVGEGAEQAGVVALVQADGWFVQDVKHPHQTSADLARQANALGFAAGKRVGAAIQRQVVQSDIHQKAQPSTDFLDDLVGDFPAPAGEFQSFEMPQDGLHRPAGERRQGGVVDEHVARVRLQAGAVAGGARPHRQILRQALAHHARLGLPVTPLHVRDHALEAVLARHRVATLVHIAEIDAFRAGTVQDGVLVLLGQPLERAVNVEAVVARQRAEHVEVVHVAPIPAADRAFGQVEVRLRDHEIRVEILLHAQAVACRTGAGRVVEREHARFQLADAVAACRAGETTAEGEILAFGIHETHHRDVLALLQSGLEGLRQPLLGALANAQAIHHRLDRVLLVLVQRRRMIEAGDDAVDAGADEAAGNQLGEHVLVLALALADHRREHHDAFAFRQAQHLVHHLAHGLRGEWQAVLGAARLADAGEQQAQVVVDLGDGAHRGARIVRGGLLLDGNGRREPFDVVHIRLFHHRQELASVGGERLHIAPLAFRVQGVESKGRLARPRKPRHHHEPVARKVEVDVLEIVRARAAHGDAGQRRRRDGLPRLGRAARGRTVGGHAASG